MNNILNKEEIELLKISGKILRDACDHVSSIIKPGITTWEVDQVAESFILEKGGKPSFKNYLVEGVGNYPATICISINHQVVHGVPSKDKVIYDGDLVSVDLGVEYKGLYTDSAFTVGVGQISEPARRLLETTKYCLQEGIKQARTGNYTGDIGNAVQKIAEGEGFGVVRSLVGHGIGRKPHLKPQIPNYGDPKSGNKLEEGMALAIEPMITLGHFEVEQEKDGWTISTRDKSLAAHFEHTVIIINGEPVVVTA